MRGVASALEDEAAAAAVREAADGGANEVRDGLEEALVLAGVSKHGEKMLLRGEKKTQHSSARSAQ